MRDNAKTVLDESGVSTSNREAPLQSVPTDQSAKNSHQGVATPSRLYGDVTSRCHVTSRRFGAKLPAFPHRAQTWMGHEPFRKDAVSGDQPRRG